MVFPTTLLASFLSHVAADTLTVQSFQRTSCTNGLVLQTVAISKLNDCHNSNDVIQASRTANVAQSFFNRELRLFVFDQLECRGYIAAFELLNGIGAGV